MESKNNYDGVGLKIIQLPVSEVHPYPNNPRINDDAVIPVAKSISEFGFRSPIIVDKNHVVICGHTRLKAAQKLGLETVPVHVASDLSAEQTKALRLADNRTGETLKMGFELLGLGLMIAAVRIFLDEFGFSELELHNSREGDPASRARPIRSDTETDADQ